eukprot:g1436.t1
MLAASAPLVVRSGASTVVLGCEECDELGRTLHQKLSALPEVDRLVLVERQRLWEALEVQSIDVLVGKHWRFTGPALAGLMKAWRSSSSRVVGIHLPAPSLPAGLEDTPAVLLGLMARYASSNAQLALRCDPGDRERRAETARLVTSRLDVAQQALRSRQPDGELLIQEWTQEAGVRHIDTAENYGNAEDLARAMRDSEVPREEIFVATKLSSTGLDQASSYRALASELQRLGGAADLCYLHFPSEKNLPAWRALEQLQQEGREWEPPSNAFLRWLAALPGKGLTVVAASTLNPEATGKGRREGGAPGLQGRAQPSGLGAHAALAGPSGPWLWPWK